MVPEYPELLLSLLSLDSLNATTNPTKEPTKEPTREPNPSSHSLNLDTYTLHQHSIINEDSLIVLLDALPTNVQRVKGFAETERGERLVQKVGNRQQLCASFPDHDHQLVFIASPSNTQLSTVLSQWAKWFRLP